MYIVAGFVNNGGERVALDKKGWCARDLLVISIIISADYD